MHDFCIHISCVMSSFYDLHKMSKCIQNELSCALSLFLCVCECVYAVCVHVCVYLCAYLEPSGTLLVRASQI